MRKEVPYQILLPVGYEYPEKNYPVLYLLHGLFGNCRNWLELTDLQSYAADKKFIIVLPDGGDRWYCDGENSETEKCESYFFEEFFPQIEASYRISNRKGSRAVAGLSMGGYGALKFAFKKPEQFAFAGSMSGAFHAAQCHEAAQGADWENLSTSISDVFGSAESATRRKNDLFQMVENATERKIKILPEIYFDCGKEDVFLHTNRELASLLEKKNIKYTYHELSGGHDWIYWDKQIKEILRIVSDKFEAVKV